MAEIKQPIRGLRNVRLGDFNADLTHAQIMALDKLGVIKDEGITQNAGGESEEFWKNSLGATEDSVSEKEQSTYEGIMLINSLEDFAERTGGEATEVGAGADKVIKYVGPDGSNTLKKSIWIETDTEPVPEKPVIWGWKKASILISPELNFGRKKWLEAKFKITPLSPDIALKPTAE